MSYFRLTPILSVLTLCVVLTSCTRNSDDVWEDTKSCSRHMRRGLCTLGGKGGDSRAVQCREEFFYTDDFYGEGDFIPLEDDQRNGDMRFSEMSYPQAARSPGDPGSQIPGIEAFRDPSTIPSLAGVFRNIHFEYNQYLVKGEENKVIIKNIADYMKSHPNTFLFIEGHCDERGPEAYNLALGSRRANAVRNMMVEAGVPPEHLFTISYGKERPLVMDHHEEGWSLNRRAEFKIYQH
jgi:peptidoglycan-associated lipoprotein